MTSVEFAFGIEDIVTNTVTRKNGVITMCAIDDGGKKYFVQGDGEGLWWAEKMLRLAELDVQTSTQPGA